jgi:hypothetical protein
MNDELIGKIYFYLSQDAILIFSFNGIHKPYDDKRDTWETEYMHHLEWDRGKEKWYFDSYPDKIVEKSEVTRRMKTIEKLDEGERRDILTIIFQSEIK